MNGNIIAHKSVFTNGYMYTFGGEINDNPSNFVQCAQLKPDVDSISELPVLPYTLSQHAAVIRNNNVYLIGGAVDGMPSDKVFMAKLSSTGCGIEPYGGCVF